jgi:hypothetical protein
MRKRISGLTIGLLLVACFHGPVYAQTLSEIFVSRSGNVLGAIFYFDPGFPSYAFVKGGGQLVWVDMEIPNAVIEIYTTGYVQLVEQEPPASITYADGRISKIGDLGFEYESGRIRKIGNLSFAYHFWRISKVGDVRIVIEDGFIRDLGDVHFEYENGRVRKIDSLIFTYENGRIQRIGQVIFDYDYGTLKKVTGEIPGVSLTISSVIEFRKFLKRR